MTVRHETGLGAGTYAYIHYMFAAKLFDFVVAASRDSLVFLVEVLLKVFNFGVGPVDIAKSSSQVAHLVTAIPSPASSIPTTTTSSVASATTTTTVTALNNT